MVWELDGPTPILKISRTLRSMRVCRLLHREQRGVAADCGGVDREGALVREAVQVMRPAGLGSRPRETAAAKGLHAHYRADHVAVDVHVPRVHARSDPARGAVDPRVDTEGESIARGVDGVDERLEPVGSVTQHMDDRAEDLTLEPADGVDLDREGREEVSLGRIGPEPAAMLPRRTVRDL